MKMGMRHALVAAGLGFLVGLVAGCPPASPCNSHADCRPENRCMSGTCQPFNPECRRNIECTSKHPGESWRCRQDTGACVPLLSAECTSLLMETTDLEDDGSVWLGVLLPLSGPDRSTGLPILNSIELARRDFRTLGGLPALSETERRRPINFVACDDTNEPVAAARHLSEVVGVPAIIGAAFSGVTLTVANQVTIDDGVLLMSPSATSTFITDLDDRGLVWRTSPPDTLQAQALAGAVVTLEPQIRTDAALQPTDDITVSVLHKGDGYGVALADALFEPLTFNGRPAAQQDNNFQRLNYGDPDDPTNTNPEAGFTAAVNSVLTRGTLPHLIIIVGTVESITEIFIPLESGWPTTAPKPYYLFADGSQLPELTTYVAGSSNPDNLRRRILGSVPGTTSTANGLFRNRYLSLFTDGTSPQVFGSAGGYDAVYLLAFAAASLKGDPITGTALSTALHRLVPPGPRVAVGATVIGTTFAALTANSTDHVDFDGASGPLDFDVSTGEAPSDVQLWCIARISGSLSFAFTGRYYDALAGAMAGTLACP